MNYRPKCRIRKIPRFYPVALLGGRGGYSPPPPPIDMSTKMQNGKNTSFLALRDCFMHWSGLNSGLKHYLKYMFRGGANLSKIKPTNK